MGMTGPGNISPLYICESKGMTDQDVCDGTLCFKA